MENVLSQHIEKTPEVVGGRARIAGHRIRVLDIVVWHERRGLSPDEILGLYPSITLGDVHAALAYYFDHRAEIEEDLQKEADLVATMKARFPSKLQERLRA